MAIQLPPTCRAMLPSQAGVISRRQALAGGLTAAVIDNQLRAGRWQTLQTGVYATFTGSPARPARLWAVVLCAGTGAVLSHQTAAELAGMTEPGGTIHVTVPVGRTPAPIRGAVVHRSIRVGQARHPARQPPRTRIEATTLDLAETAPHFDDAFGWLCRSVGRRLTTASRLRAELDGRPKVRWRAGLIAALDDIGAGVASGLEQRYATGVERAHGLPAATRQVRLVLAGQVRYIDNLYEQAGLAVELDGQAAHPVEDRWADMHRDNAHAAVGLITLRYSWADVTLRPCQVAREVGAVLRRRGAPVVPRRCGRNCAVGPP